MYISIYNVFSLPIGIIVFLSMAYCDADHA